MPSPAMVRALDAYALGDTDADEASTELRRAGMDPSDIKGRLAEQIRTCDEPVKAGRLLKVTCPTCGYVVRTTRKWLETAGAPICPVHRQSMKPNRGE